MQNWDDIRIFLTVARQGGLASAAQSLGINHTTVARRLSALEAVLRARLAVRSPSGITLTSAGRDFLAHAERMESAAQSAEQQVYATDNSVGGKVRLATREAFGAWLVCPRIGLLQERHPTLQLELVSEARNISLLKRDADITVSLHYPTQSRVIVQKLTDYRLGLFASHDYLKKHGPIRRVEDLKKHDVIWYIGDMIDMDEQRYMHRITSMSRASFRATDILAQYAAMISGAGIGIIPLYQAGRDAALARVLPREVEETRTYWMSTHPDTHNLPNVRAVAAFLVDIVREKKRGF
ncbi:MAG: bacterial regulatory helix-turn-helix, lysR family protein [Candidatus Kaiserbacteria bacterium]|jgi:DNA-binding transcriptional LysR family regulator|nr:bacterial regulatory helix-turn-helix, lysR family protein [Candidatus Kaiserbacteria bacterium]